MSYINQLPPKKTDNRSQCQQVKEYLLAGNTLTSFEAYRLFNITCLAQRVHDLRTRYGFEVTTNNVTHNGKRFAIYSCEPCAAANVSAPVEG